MVTKPTTLCSGKFGKGTFSQVTMGGLAKCTTAKLNAIDAKIVMNSDDQVWMTQWYPQDFDIKGTTFVPT